MRLVLLILVGLLYLFGIVYIESELVKLNIRKMNLKNQIQELKNEKASLQTKITDVSNLARIEIEANKRGFVFPKKEDILGIIE